MSKNKIKEFISANALFSKTKLWVPIFFTIIIGFSLLNDFFDTSYNFLELSSLTLFQVIYIISFWIMHFSSKEYSQLHVYIVDYEKNDQSIFDEEQERTFLTILKKLGTYIMILILVLLIFEGYRLIYDLVYMASSIKIIIFVALLISSLFAFVGCLIKSRQLLAFLKSISIGKSKE